MTTASWTVGVAVRLRWGPEGYFRQNFSHSYPPISIPISKFCFKLISFYHNLPKVHSIYVIWAPSSLMKTHGSLYQISRKSTPKGRHIIRTPCQCENPPLRALRVPYRHCMNAGGGGSSCYSSCTVVSSPIKVLSLQLFSSWQRFTYYVRYMRNAFYIPSRFKVWTCTQTWQRFWIERWDLRELYLALNAMVFHIGDIGVLTFHLSMPHRLTILGFHWQWFTEYWQSAVCWTVDHVTVAAQYNHGRQSHWQPRGGHSTVKGGIMHVQ